MPDRTVYHKTVRVGGGADALDTVDGTNLLDKDAAIVQEVGANALLYLLDADFGGVADDINTIAPITNAGLKRWRLSSSPFLLSGTGSPPSATGLPEGTIYFKYTA